jgi:AraC-like DNA-binding protein
MLAEPQLHSWEPDTDALLDHLKVRVDAFAMCEIDDHCGLRVAGFDNVIVHYVLDGEGTIVSEHGVLPIRSGMLVVIPTGLAKQINGRGETHHVSDANAACPLMPGIMKFSVSSGSGSALLLGCASVDAQMGDGLKLFENLAHPLAIEDHSEIISLSYRVILRELAQARSGAKALIDTLMKQALIVVLRDCLAGGKDVATVFQPFRDPQLMRVVNQINTRPQDSYTVTSLARAAGMSRSCFARKFNDEFGVTPMCYVQSVRLTAASTQLQCSAKSVKSIAGSLGFGSRSQFSRSFTAMFGIDPTAFRQLESSIDASTGDPRRAQPVGNR